MDSSASKFRDVDADIETGLVTSEGDLTSDISNIKGTRQTSFFMACNSESTRCESRVNNNPIASNQGDGISENARLMVDRKTTIDRNTIVVENKVVKEKPKSMSAKKPPKPPRPPRGLSLDSADQKLIRELDEIAKLKRARLERMKALKKMKEAKSASSKNQLFATILTVVFCLVLLLQGISSRTGSTSSLQGSPTSSGGSIYSTQHYVNLSGGDANGPGSESPRFVQQMSGFDPEQKVKRAVG